jgi:hypothetical protein
MGWAAAVRRYPRRALTVAAAVLVVAAVTTWLVRAPQPAAAGPVTSTGASGENAPHVHVTGDGMSGMSGAALPVEGTSARAGGYTLRPATSAFTAGVAGVFTFRIEGADGRPVTRFAIQRDKPMHLIIARHDLTGYQHLHPTMAPDGTWSVPLTLAQPGTYRAYADFAAIDAKGTTAAAVLAVDLTVAGASSAAPLPPPAVSTDLAGFTVSYQGRPAIGTVQPLLFTIARGNTLVTPEHYLGSFGHLVVLRQGDLAYLHVHPEDTLDSGAVKFWLAAPGPGDYRMYLDFQVDGQVHTAEFTLTVA